MGLIKCWFCEAEIDDTLKDCPHCNMPVITFPVVGQEAKETAQEDLFIHDKTIQEHTSKGQTTHKEPIVGSVPAPDKSLSQSPKKRSKKPLVIALVVFILVVVTALAVFFIYQENEKRMKKEAEEAQAQIEEKYQNYIDVVVIEILAASGRIERCGSLTHDVWYNSIFEEYDERTDKYTITDGSFNDDFNTSISALFSDEEFKNELSEIISDRNEIEGFMREMTNPPEKFRDAYNSIKSLYDTYVSFTELVTSPSGNLTSFTEKFNSLDNEITASIKAMNIYMSEGLISYWPG